MDGVVEREEDDPTRPDARRVDIAPEPPHERDRQRDGVAAADGAHVQARVVLAHALVECDDQREQVGDDAGQRDEDLVVESDTFVDVQLYVVGSVVAEVRFQRARSICLMECNVERVVDRHKGSRNSRHVFVTCDSLVSHTRSTCSV